MEGPISAAFGPPHTRRYGPRPAGPRAGVELVVASRRGAARGAAGAGAVRRRPCRPSAAHSGPRGRCGDDSRSGLPRSSRAHARGGPARLPLARPAARRPRRRDRHLVATLGAADRRGAVHPPRARCGGTAGPTALDGRRPGHSSKPCRLPLVRGDARAAEEPGRPAGRLCHPARAGKKRPSAQGSGSRPCFSGRVAPPHEGAAARGQRGATSATFPMPGAAPCSRAPRCWSYPRGTKDSGFRCSRRWRWACRS